MSDSSTIVVNGRRCCARCGAAPTRPVDRRNFPTVLIMRDFGTPAQFAEWMPGFLDGTRRLAFGLTEPNHGSDATYLDHCSSRRRRVGSQRYEALEQRASSCDPRHHLRPYRWPTRRPVGDQRLSCPDRRPRLQGRVFLVNIQHADRPRRGLADRRAGRDRCRVRHDRSRARVGATLRA